MLAAVPIALAALLAGASGEPPEGRRGVQLAFAVHASAPLGTLGSGLAMGNVAGAQFEGEGALLWKLTPRWGAGVYLSAGSGASGDTPEPACTTAGPGCAVHRVLRFGLEVRHDLSPAARWNPWLSFGAGLEALSFDTTSLGEPELTTYHGYELARLGLGVDLRSSGMLGVGVAVLGSIGEYTDVEVRRGQGVEGSPVVDEHALVGRGLHGWVGLGLRIVLFP